MDMDSEERTRWNSRYKEKPGSWTDPDDLLVNAYDKFLHLSPSGLALDVAGGAGRNALFLLQRGWRVKLLDISEVGLELARKKAAAEGLSANLMTELMDLSTTQDVGTNQFDLITVFFFLRRELFPALAVALKPGGFLVYKTYTTARRDCEHGPGDPRYLLEPDELREAFSSLHVQHYQERTQGKSTAELIAKK
jgi:SAM-dependent methyltransferase